MSLRETTTVNEAAVLLGVDRTSAFRAIREGTFPVPVIRVGRRILIPTAALERLLSGAEPLQPPTDSPQTDNEGEA